MCRNQGAGFLTFFNTKPSDLRAVRNGVLAAPERIASGHIDPCAGDISVSTVMRLYRRQKMLHTAGRPFSRVAFS
jgi:hypothetical protein